MIHVVDKRLRDEAVRYRLVFACERCAHFDAETRRCSFGYPNADHLGSDLEGRATLTFCKSFELG